MTPVRFPRLNAQTVALIGKKNLKDHKCVHRALQRLAATEEAGVDFHDGAKLVEVIFGPVSESSSES
jgi:hypothetical protein